MECLHCILPKMILEVTARKNHEVMILKIVLRFGLKKDVKKRGCVWEGNFGKRTRTGALK